MLKIQQVKRLALQNAQGSRAEGGPRRVGGSCWGPPFIGRRSVWRSGGGLGSADLSAGVVFGAPEVVWGLKLRATARPVLAQRRNLIKTY